MHKRFSRKCQTDPNIYLSHSDGARSVAACPLCHHGGDLCLGENCFARSRSSARKSTAPRPHHKTWSMPCTVPCIQRSTSWPRGKLPFQRAIGKVIGRTRPCSFTPPRRKNSGRNTAS